MEDGGKRSKPSAIPSLSLGMNSRNIFAEHCSAVQFFRLSQPRSRQPS